MTKENPDMSFKEQNKRLEIAWKNLSEEAKLLYLRQSRNVAPEQYQTLTRDGGGGRVGSRKTTFSHHEGSKEEAIATDALRKRIKTSKDAGKGGGGGGVGGRGCAVAAAVPKRTFNEANSELPNSDPYTCEASSEHAKSLFEALLRQPLSDVVSSPSAPSSSSFSSHAHQGETCGRHEEIAAVGSKSSHASSRTTNRQDALEELPFQEQREAPQRGANKVMIASYMTGKTLAVFASQEDFESRTGLIVQPAHRGAELEPHSLYELLCKIKREEAEALKATKRQKKTKRNTKPTQNGGGKSAKGGPGSRGGVGGRGGGSDSASSSSSNFAQSHILLALTADNFSSLAVETEVEAEAVASTTEEAVAAPSATAAFILQPTQAMSEVPATAEVAEEDEDEIIELEEEDEEDGLIIA